MAKEREKERKRERERFKFLKWPSKAIIVVNWFSCGVQAGTMVEESINRGCLYDNCTPSFLLLLIFDWRTLSRRVKHGDDVSQQKSKCQPIRTWEIGGVSL